MSSAMTFSDLLDNLNSIYIEYKELPDQKKKLNPDGFIKKNMRKITNLFSDQTSLNEPVDNEEYDISPTEFIKRCIRILEPYLEKDIRGVSKHDEWEFTSFEKLDELKKINSYTNKKTCGITQITPE